MQCSCIRGTGRKFDFYLESLDCETLIFKDLSNWSDDEGYEIPSVYPMKVILPISNVEVEVEFIPQSTTKFTAENLQTSTCIPDGVYCFTVESCGYTYTRHAAVVCTLECRLDTLISRVSSEEDIEKATLIKTYIDSVRTNARMGKLQEAASMFNIARRELDNLNCDC